MNPRLAEAALALSLLTRLPLPRLRACPSMGASAWAWPRAGIAVGAGQGGVLLAGGALPPAVAAGLAVAAGMVLTGGLHEDGLTDLADGLGGGRDAAHRLEIMKDSRIGSHGAAALIVAIGLRWSALAVIAGWPPGPMLGTLIAVQAASRAGMGLMNRLGPQARRRGFAHAATEGLTAGRAAAAVALGTGIALIVLPLGQALAVLAAIALVQAGLLIRARRALGGVTGDVLGAAQVAAEIAALALVVA